MPQPDLAQHAKHAQFTSLLGHRIAYWRHGDVGRQTTVVFIHGFPSAAWDWHNQWQALNKSHALLAMDLLGFGFSDKPHPYRYSIIEQADIVSELCVQQGISRCFVVAHDYGNSVAQELLARQTEHTLPFVIEKLCWLNGGLFAESHRPLLTQKLLHSPLGPLIVNLMSKGTMARSFSKIFGAATQPKPQEIDILWTLLNHHHGRRVLPALLDYLDERQTYRDRWVTAMQQVAKINRQSLCFINGVHDPISGKHMLDQFRRCVPEAETVALDVGHYPQLEVPHEVNNALIAFLNADK
ncbi:alpha/beta fold hydrolase [Alteromonas oceanisediminis]|uniref:alpha/beta fold hydrolase n=1 Tax=Alteromonas oceanisediminis TaxID=2836180 RepID=UPI001BD995A9|nr:alpha/beta hydrolase [Alteromonas oceanisediminis]MBT0587428.1 alpha/beta hydrolase [Alteromonas oceanisediminis]